MYYHFDYIKAKNQVNDFFKALRRHGYVARQNYYCCGGCGAYALGELFEKKGIPEGDARKAVFYHRQDTQRFKETGKLLINWGGNGQEIVAIAHEVGLMACWDGTSGDRIRFHFA